MPWRILQPPPAGVRGLAAATLLLAAAGQATASVPPLVRQEARPGLRIALGPASGLPGTDVVLPVYLWDAAGTAGTLEVRMRFPAGLVAFSRAERTFLSEMAGAEIRLPDGDEAAAAGPGTARLVVAPAGGAGPAQPLPEGPVAYLTFRILPDTPMDAEIHVAAEARVFRGTGAPDWQPLPVVEGRITVQAAPVSSCFFYMH